VTTELAFTEGLHYMKTHAMDGATVYGFLVHTQLISTGDITSSSTLAGLSEENGTGYVRPSITLAADANGIAVIPSWEINALTAVGWHNDATVVGIASAVSSGVGLYAWELGSEPYDMSGANADLFIPSVSFFYQNPLGI
jgi:hypothetical protein